METMICEAPMSYTGAFKRTQLWLASVGNDFGRVSATIGLLILWWALVTAWYFALSMPVIPLLWTVPYRVMRRRQRSERYTRALAARMTIADYTTSMPAIPKND